MRNKLYGWIGLAFLMMAGFSKAADATNAYMIVDLPLNLSTYSISYTNAVPSGGWTDADKTSRLILRRISRGTFVMGSPTTEDGHQANETQRTVTLSNDFYVGVFEVTREQWSRVVNNVLGGDKIPKSLREIGDASQVYNNFFDNLNHYTAKGFALPDEAQWEYACRAGSTNAYCYGNATNLLPNYAWYVDNASGIRKNVGQLTPNAWGLYDMHGNVSELANSLSGGGLWECGGACNSAAIGCRCAVRGSYVSSDSTCGFRVCLEIPTDYYTLSVSNGTAEASTGTNGQWIAIWADPPAVGSNMIFDRWTGDTNTVADIFSSNTVVQIAGTNIELNASYREAPYTLTIYNETNTVVERHAKGDLVTIEAEAPVEMTCFDHWQVVPDGVNLGTNFVSTSSLTMLIMPGMDLELTAVYTNVPTFALTVGGGTGSGNYTNGQIVAIEAPEPPAHHTFRWTGDTATVADVLNWQTTVTMPSNDVTVTATYPAILYSLTVNGGLGSGNYTNGQVVTVIATSLPSSLHVFNRWAGDTNAVADISAVTTTVTIAGTTVLTPVYQPLPMAANTYMIVDLTNSSTNGGITYTDDIPDGGWTDTYKTDKMVFRRIPAGTFTMGSPTTEAGRLSEETQHKVALTEVFYMGLFEVTQAQWNNLMGTWPSAYSNEDDRATHPVEKVSYATIRGSTNGAKWPSSSAVDSSSFMGQFRSATGSATFDLPTEAQWEYACRAGTTGAYAGTLGEMAAYSGNSDGSNTWSVGQLSPNAWGLYDMHGNVQEICLDWFAGDYGSSAQTDPKGATGSNVMGLALRIKRGGAYNLASAYCRSAYRGNLQVTNLSANTGLRVAQTVGAAYSLKVVNGVVNTGGTYVVGTQIPVSAMQKGDEWAFAKWTVSPASSKLGSLFSETDPDTVVTMPSNAVVLTATYSVVSNYTVLTVSNGSGGGTYDNGEYVTITADDPPAWYVFDRWTGDTNGVTDVLATHTTVYMGGGDVQVAATYRVRDDLPSNVYSLLVVGNSETNSQLVEAGTSASVVAPDSPTNTVFGWWTVSPADAALGDGFDRNAAETTVVMPSGEVTLTATYVADPGSSPGYVNVKLTDASGVALASARWSSDSGKNWYPAGICPLKSGSYTVSFLSPSANWVAPDSVKVTVKAAMTNTVSGVFQWVSTVSDGDSTNATVGVAFTAAANIGSRPSTYMAKYLPTGLKINSKSGVISGVPTKAGVYAVSVTAKGTDKTVTTGSFTITVVALPTLAQGTFTGYVGSHLSETNRLLSGLFTMSVSSVGRITAKVTAQKAIYTFSGSSWARIKSGTLYCVVLRTSKGETWDVAVDSSDGSLTGVATNGAFGVDGFDVAGQRNAFLDKTDGTAQAELAQYSGYYTVALPVQSCTSGGWVDNSQDGSGYMTLTVKAKGVVTLAGKMAEGTSLSASTTLLADDEGAYVPVFVPLYSKRGVVSGLLKIEKGTSVPASNRVELCNGVALTWQYPGKSTTATEDRFDVTTSAVGAYYDSLVSLQAYYADAALTAENQTWEVPLAFKSSGAVYLMSGTNNPANATLSIASRTGLFSGGFKVGTTLLKYYGVLTLDGSSDIGLGSYVVPQTLAPYKAKPSFQVMIE